MPKLLYTLESENPKSMNASDHKVALKKHYDLLDMLSDSGKNKYKNLLISVMRFVFNFNKTSDIITKKVVEELINDFEGSDNYKDLYIVEWYDGGKTGKDIVPLYSGSMADVIMKGLVLKMMLSYHFNTKDIDVITNYYNIDDSYWDRLRNIPEDARKVEFVHAYNYYLFEFYKRSTNPDEEALKLYKIKSRSNYVGGSFLIKDIINTVGYEISLYGCIEQTLTNINKH